MVLNGKNDGKKNWEKMSKDRANWANQQTCGIDMGYHLVMTNIANWKISTIDGGF